MIALVLSGLVLVLVRERARDLEDAQHHNEDLVRILAEQTARTVQTMDLTLLSVIDALTRGHVGGAPGSRDVREFLEQTRVRAPFIRALSVIDARGVIIHRSGPPFTRPLDVSDRAYFTRQRDDPGVGLFIGPPVVSRADGQWGIPVSRALVTSTGRFAGIVSAIVAPHFFQEIYEALNVRPDGSVAMFLRDGTLIVRHPHVESIVGTSLTGPAIFRDPLARASAGSFRTSSRVDGMVRWISYRTVAGLPLVVFVSRSEAEILTAWWRQVITSTMGALVFVGMIAGLSVALTRRVRKLTDSEERFRSLFDRSLDAIVLGTPTGKVLAANPSAERLFGLSEADLRAQGCAGRVEPSDPAIAGALEEHERTGRFHGEVTLRRGDGTTFPAEITLSRFHDRRAASRTVLIVRDVSERKTLEAQVRLQSAALESAANAIIIADRDGAIVWSNRATTTLTGYSTAELSGQNPRLLKSDGNPPELYQELWRTITAGRPWHGVLINRRKDGTLYHEEQTITPVRNKHDAISHFVAIKQDITERLRTDEELTRQRALARQQERLAEMGRLLAGVAHELNNPLAVVLGNATLLQQRARDAAVAQRADKIAASATRCARIVKNFLALAREYPPEMQCVDLNAVVGEAVELLGYQMRVESITVVSELADDLPDLWADRHQLQQVLINLVTNACHALRQTPAARQVTLVTRHDATGGRVLLEVRDNGSGIAESVRARLFEPFVTTKPVGEGTGLGLSICKSIVESHGGTISAESAEGEGTTFRIELPIGTAIVAAPEPAVPATIDRELSVLIIDDEPQVADVLREMVAARGHDVDTAPNGAAALAKVNDGAYDLVLCDLKMPVMDGREFFEALVRERPELARRLVFLTGDTFSSETSSFLANAGRPCVSKPFSEDSLWRAIAAATLRTAETPAPV